MWIWILLPSLRWGQGMTPGNRRHGALLQQHCQPRLQRGGPRPHLLLQRHQVRHRYCLIIIQFQHLLKNIFPAAITTWRVRATRWLRPQRAATRRCCGAARRGLAWGRGCWAWQWRGVAVLASFITLYREYWGAHHEISFSSKGQ